MTAPPIIYVVDDDASFRTALGDLLAVCGYTVVLCESAKRLLEASPGEEPGCILLDVQMSELSGPQLQDRLTDLGCRLPIVFITGHGDIPTTVQTIKAGAEDFLTKPVQKEVLLAAIGRALVRYEAMRAQRRSGRRTTCALFPADPSRARGLGVAGSRPNTQADRPYAGYRGADDQTASAQCDAEA